MREIFREFFCWKRSVESCDARGSPLAFGGYENESVAHFIWLQMAAVRESPVERSSSETPFP
jgi:hypothetical protein